MQYILEKRPEHIDERVCKQCSRKLPEAYKPDICQACMEIILFSEVKEYIRNNEVNEQDVASHFEIPIAKVRSWIKEGRIQYKNDPKENITSLYCRVCGKKIAFGVVCPECHSLENLKGVAANQVKKGELGAMRFLGK